MALTRTDGTTTTTGSETDLFDVSTGGPKYFTTILFLHNLTATETCVLKVYIYDTNATSYRLFQSKIYIGVQTESAAYIPTLLSMQYKVTVQMTAGTNRAITCERFEQTA